MGDPAEFKGHVEMLEYADRNGLDYAWQNTALFEKRRRTMPPGQFEVRPVRTKRGVTMVGLFSAAITRAEQEADAPYREAIEWRGPSDVWRARWSVAKRGSRGTAPRTPLTYPAIRP